MLAITIVVYDCDYCTKQTSVPFRPIDSLVVNKTGEEKLFCSAMCKSLFIAETAGVFLYGRGNEETQNIRTHP